MPATADGFQIPDDPREIMLLLDKLRIRIYAVAELLEITTDETDRLRADHAALTDAVRATESAEALAQEWREFRSRLLYGSEAAVSPPETTVIPPVAGGIGTIVREAQAARNPPVRAGVSGRLQGFIEHVIAHPNTTDRTLHDLGLLPGATIGFSPGQPSA